MREIVTEELLKKVENRFLLSIVAAKRARQLNDGAVPLIEKDKEDHDLILALGEIMADKIAVQISDDPGIIEPVETAEKETKKKKSKK